MRTISTPLKSRANFAANRHVFNPQASILYYTLASSSVSLRLYKESVAFAREAVRLNPRDWQSMSVLGVNLLRIGEENEDAQMRSTSVVSIGYGMDDLLLGGMGVVGPTRMDYPSTIAAVRAVANYVGQILAGK